MAVGLLMGTNSAMADVWSITFDGMVTDNNTGVTISDAVATIGTRTFGTASWGSTDLVETSLWSTETQDNFTLSSSNFKNITTTSKLRVYCKDFGQYYWSLNVRGPGYSDPQFSNSEAGLSGNADSAPASGYFDFEFSETSVNMLSNQGLEISIGNLTVTSVVLYAPQGSSIDSKFVLETGTSWLLRSTNGLYNFNSGNRSFGILNCEEGETITINITTDPNPQTNATLLSSEGDTYVYRVSADGHVEFRPARYSYLHSISIAAAPAKHTVSYYIDGSLYTTQSLSEGATIVPPTPDAREHYSFAWGYYPETMPGQDVTVNGSYTAIPTHNVKWILNYNENDIVRTDVVYEGEPIPTPPTVNRHGYSFDGWGEIPSVMPNYDITINGTTTQNLFTITFVVDGTTIETREMEKGAYITVPTVTTDEGKKVEWEWYNTIVQGNATITGKIVDIPKHKLTYYLDNSYYKSYEIYEDAAITPEADPVRAGYTFTGWTTIPETMGNSNYAVYGYFSQNYLPQSPTWEEMSVTYTISAGSTFTSGQTVSIENENGVTAATLTYGESGGNAFSAAVEHSPIIGFDGFVAYTEGNGTNGNQTGGTFYTITPNYDGFIAIGVVLNKEKALYILEDGTPLSDYNGLTNSVKYMGAYGFSVKAGSTYKIYAAGSKLGFYGFKFDYSTPKYTLTYQVDGRDYHIDRLEEGAVPTLPTDPTKTGYTFTGWSGVPNYMPAEAVIAEAQFSLNSYKLTYVVDGETVEEIWYYYGSTVTPRSNPSQYGYTFSGWNNLPATMPAHDVTVEGRFLKEIQYINVPITSSTGYATFSYDEPLDFSKATGIKAYIVRSVGQSTAALEEVTGVIAAGTGLIVKGSTATVPTSNTSLGVSPAGNLLVGVTSSSQTIMSADSYVLTEVNGAARFQATEGHEAVIPANHAYLQAPAAGARQLTIIVNGETTGLTAPAVSTAKTGVVYDLQGRPVQNPKKGSLYIIDGKKTVFK